MSIGVRLVNFLVRVINMQSQKSGIKIHLCKLSKLIDVVL